MKVKVKEEENETCSIRLKMYDSVIGDFFRMLATRQHAFTQK